MHQTRDLTASRALRPYVLVRRAAMLAERHPRAGEDVHFAQALVEAVLTDLTEPGDRVLDPFAGFGTTPVVAERLGRVATGVELLPDRCAVIAEVAPHSTVIRGDARHLTDLLSAHDAAEPYDLVLTSPPYRTEHDHPEDPLAGYEVPGPDYPAYLDQVAEVMRQAVQALRPGGLLVLNVANIFDGRFTPLAWDVGRAVSAVVPLVQESFVCWDQPLDDLAGDHLLVFRRPPAPGD